MKAICRKVIFVKRSHVQRSCTCSAVKHSKNKYYIEIQHSYYDYNSLTFLLNLLDLVLILAKFETLRCSYGHANLVRNDDISDLKSKNVGK